MEEDAEEVEYEQIKKDDSSDERKTKYSFDAEDLSTDDIDEIMRKCNGKHPEGSPDAGVFKYASMFETKLEEKETEIEMLFSSYGPRTCHIYSFISGS